MLHRSTESPANIKDVLQKLESDYMKMRDEILAGIPLDHLKPLTIDCDQVRTGMYYIHVMTKKKRLKEI